MADGRLAIVNNGNCQVLLLDIHSGQATAIGRRGDGPGEFEGAVQLEFDGSDHLVVNSRHGMALGYDSLGNFTKSYPIPVGSYLLAMHQDSLDLLIRKLADNRQASGEVIRVQRGQSSGRILIPSSDRLLAKRAGLVPGIIPIPAYAASDSLIAIGEGFTYRIEIRSVDGTGPLIADIGHHLNPRHRTNLERLATEFDMELAAQNLASARGGRSMVRGLERLRATIDTQSLRHFTHRGLHFAVGNRLLVIGTTGDAAFVDVYSGVDWQARQRLHIPCFRSRTAVAASDPWIVLICESPPEEAQAPGIRLFKLEPVAEAGDTPSGV